MAKIAQTSSPANNTADSTIVAMPAGVASQTDKGTRFAAGRRASS